MNQFEDVLEGTSAVVSNVTASNDVVVALLYVIFHITPLSE
jgi:hypothetical protein